MSPPVVLIHGGLGEAMDANRFWIRPGVLEGLRAAGFDVTAPDRDTTPRSWRAAADTASATIQTPTSVVAGSNGVSVAVRLALQHRHLVDRLVLLWPATCGDPVVDATAPPAASHLLAGDTLRGVSDDELLGLDVAVTVMAADPANRFHAHRTVDRLLELLPRAAPTPVSFPEPLRTQFNPKRHAFITTLEPYLR